jgi:hypothetical protein
VINEPEPGQQLLAAQLPSQSAPDLASYEIRLMAGVSS